MFLRVYRSTKSEKLYPTNTSPALLSNLDSGSALLGGGGGIRGDPCGAMTGVRSGMEGCYITSQPTSPTPPPYGGGSSMRLPMSPLNSARGSLFYTTDSGPASVRGKEDDCKLGGAIVY